MEDIKAELIAQLQNKTAFEIPIFGGIAIPQSVAVSWGIILLLTALAIFLTRGMQLRPTGKRQMIAEWLVGFINDFCKDSLGHHWRTFAPYLGSVGLYLACANLSGLFGVTPPTKDLNVTAGLALMSVVLIYGASFRVHGLGGGLKNPGDRNSTAVAVYATVWQHLRRFRHYGADQDGHSCGIAHPVQPVL